MIGQRITGEDGKPLDQFKNLAESSYQPNEAIKDMFVRIQNDYQSAYVLQHRLFEEFDGMSLLQRTRLDQQTFGAYVGAEFVPQQKRWRWKGRKNTARNKIIGILARMVSAMLYPYVYAQNDNDEEDKMTARVMAILVENHLKKANYEMKFMYMTLSALVNPAVIVQVEYVEAFQRIKQKLSNGEYKIIEAVDELLSGLNLNILPIDEVLFSDFYTPFNSQTCVIRVRRLNWDVARAMYAGKNFDENGKDLFSFVEPGKTRIFLTGQEYQTLYDIKWTEADANCVQEITAFYKAEDLEVTFVGGVFMGEQKDIFNSNRFKHRRMVQAGKEWMSAPVLPFAMSGFEPIDPSGRFLYYKSAAFKEYWDDATQNKMHQLAHDGTYLDVIKPIFLSGVTKADSTVMVPGAVVPMPTGASMTPYSGSPNLMAAMNMMAKQEQDMSESTQDKIMSGNLEKGVTAFAVSLAEQNAKTFLGLFASMIGDLVKQIGTLTIDCIIDNTTVGELDASLPEALRMKYKTILAKGQESGANITHRIVFTDKYMGKEYTPKQVRDMEWDLYEKAGGSDQRLWEINPYRFARTRYSIGMDVDKMIMRGAGADKQRKILAFQMMTDPRVAPYTDQEQVVNDFVVEEFADGDPEKYKRKGNPTNDMMSAVMGNQPMGAASQQNAGVGQMVVPPLSNQPVRY